jgi:uncharacterized protein
MRSPLPPRVCGCRRPRRHRGAPRRAARACSKVCDDNQNLHTTVTGGSRPALTPPTPVDRRVVAVHTAACRPLLLVAFTARLARIDWQRVARDLDADGWSRLGALLGAADCRTLTALYRDDHRFRSTVDMLRHRFGRGEYRYFAAPLPSLVAALRSGLYARLAPFANRWQTALGRAAAYPPALSEYLARCHAAGQTRPTPLLLHYRAGDYNCLHQDLYGALAFPLQVVVPLSVPGRDHDGGELVFSEQRPRSQSRATAVVATAGEGIVFTNRERPVAGTRGAFRVQMRHGLSTVTRGERFALGIIFHDAR